MRRPSDTRVVDALEILAGLYLLIRIAISKPAWTYPPVSTW